MTDLSTIRHESIFNPAKFNVPVTIIGVGATGSRLFMALVELGLTNITVIDFDIVEPHNLANQIYGYADIGKPKVEGLKNAYKLKTGVDAPETMQFINGKVPDKNIELKGYVFLLTDTMASRKDIYAKCLAHTTDIPYVIETRMASTHGNVLGFCPLLTSEKCAWLDTLSDDEDTELSPCGASISVGITASLIANMAAWQFIHRVTNPEAHHNRVDVFFKPFILAAENI
jgi:hypothetical protein